MTLLSSPLTYNIDNSQAKMLPEEALKLLNAPSIVMVHSFNTESADQFSKDIQEAVNSKEPIIPIVIDSYGGSIYAFLRMADTIQALNVPVATICVSKCMSAGLLLLSMGTKGYRWAAPNATILIHDASSSAEGKVPDVLNEAAELERLNILIFSMLAKQSGKSADFFLNKLRNMGNIDWYLTAEEAKTLGIVNHVKLPRIKVSVKTEMNFE
jgi:ATP-dependent Clp endopeptidase proteolytic subunit ClpP